MKLYEDYLNCLNFSNYFFKDFDVKAFLTLRPWHLQIPQIEYFWKASKRFKLCEFPGPCSVIVAVTNLFTDHRNAEHWKENQINSQPLLNPRLLRYSVKFHFEVCFCHVSCEHLVWVRFAGATKCWTLYPPSPLPPEPVKRAKSVPKAHRFPLDTKVCRVKFCSTVTFFGHHLEILEFKSCKPCITYI